MHYPIAIERGNAGQAWGVIVPDIPGCHSAGETLDDAIRQAREAIEGHLQILAEDGERIPVASSAEQHLDNPDYAGFVWALVEVDESKFMGKSEKINITLPGHLIHRIDSFVSTHPEYKSRSGLLAAAALKVIQQT